MAYILSKAAEYAVHAFEEVDIKGFTVGNTLFEGDNDNVRMVRILVSKMEQILEETELWRIVVETHNIGELIETLAQRATKRG